MPRHSNTAALFGTPHHPTPITLGQKLSLQIHLKPKPFRYILSTMKKPLIAIYCLYLCLSVSAEEPPDDLSLFRACLNGNTGHVQALLKAGADVNMKNNGISVLMFAVNTGNVELVKTLMTAGADVNYKNDAGIGPLFLAAYSGSEAIVSALMQKDISAEDKSVAANIAFLQEENETAARLKDAAEYGKLDYRKLRRDEYRSGAHFTAFFKVAHIFVDKEAVYRAACYLSETKDAEANINYEFYIESKERFPFIEGDIAEARLTYRALENVEVSALPYRSVEQAVFQIDKIIEMRDGNIKAEKK